MISYALRPMSRILVGSHIRIFELTKNLDAILLHGGKFKRPSRYAHHLPFLFQERSIIIFDYNPSLYDQLFFKIVKNHYHTMFDIADVPYLQRTFLGVSQKEDWRLKRTFFQLVDIADTLLMASPSYVELLGSDARHLHRKKVLIVPNASNPNFFAPTPLPHGRKKIILCVSGYAPARGIEVLVEAFHQIRKKRKDIILKLVGYNMPLKFEKAGVIIQTNKFYDSMPQVYSESSIFVIPHEKNPYMDSVLPIKLFDAMAACRPLIVTNCDEMARLAEREKCGVVTNCDPKSLSEAIDYLLSNKRVSEELGLKGREAVEKRHSWAHRAEIIKRHLRRPNQI